MINTKELRIGNWLLDAEGIQRQVAYVGETIGLYNDIGGTDKYQQNPIFSNNIEDLRPIPMTPEILEKLGFEYGKTGKKKDDSFVQFWDKRTPDHEHSFTSFHFSIVRWWRSDKPLEFAFYHHHIRSTCKYVHQLQNLFFALTGTELNYQP